MAREVAEKLVRAIESADASALGDLFAEDAVLHGLAGESEETGR